MFQGNLKEWNGVNDEISVCSVQKFKLHSHHTKGLSLMGSDSGNEQCVLLQGLTECLVNAVGECWLHTGLCSLCVAFCLPLVLSHYFHCN